MPSTRKSLKMPARIVPLLTLTAVALFAGCTSPEGRYQPGEKPTSPPPMLAPNIERPPKPGPEYEWVDGYWEWSGSSKEWQWRRGRWARRAG